MGVLDQCGQRLVEQHTARTGIIRVGSVHVDAGERASITRERQVADVGDAGGNRRARLAGIVKRPAADAVDGVGNRHSRQLATILKGVGADAGDAAGNRVAAGQSAGALEHGGHRLVKQHAARAGIIRIGDIHSHVGQVVANLKLQHADVGDAAGNRQIRQGGVSIEGIIGNGRDWIAVGGVGNDPGSVGTGVAGDGGGSVVDGVAKLGLHHGGQQQRTHQADLNQIMVCFHLVVGVVQCAAGSAPESRHCTGWW